MIGFQSHQWGENPHTVGASLHLVPVLNTFLVSFPLKIKLLKKLPLEEIYNSSYFGIYFIGQAFLNPWALWEQL